MSFWRFLVADALAALVSVPLMLYLGYVFGEHHDALFQYLKDAKYVLILIGLFGLVAAIWYFRRLRARRIALAEESEVN